ncbi:TIGR04222 domain-containing membrane protein [Novosphingobium sp.]|uniref:TIGR04222 domain-containing membrane protein n=1 Tax=Novosphingobium sp. TaxID=1874826 RepID=UPI002629AD1C|nr:TIGR04222 domain-containing membrane protein [Novosphingobium sp.]
MTGLGPFDLHGPEFLILYCELAVIALIASFVIPRYLRPEGRPCRPTDEDELALLAGGRERYAETVAVRLLSVGAVSVQSDGRLQIRDRNGGRTLAERRVVALGSPMRWGDMLLAVAGPAENAEHKLAQRGLLMDAATRQQMRLLQTAPLALLFLFGMAKWIVGTMRDRPVGILTALLIVTAIVAVLRFAVLDRQTRAGKVALADARSEAARLRRAAPTDEAPLAVALFGTSVLIGAYLSDFHRMRSAGGGGDTSSSGGCSGGSGGCGGGGCGGCGS